MTSVLLAVQNDVTSSVN